MKVAAWALGLLTLAGLIVLSIAGLTAALAILLTAVAIVVMIALGSILGARHTPAGEPKTLPGAGQDRGPSS
ncbi:MAG TPA: hypothetical protein VMU09_01880 [Acidimicrobiales bacterium]|nr:hypothetical protein [Acidimicrobiales bacterium]